MAKQVMERSASDNEYLHKDFHGALSAGLDYVAKHFGEDAVREYLRQFTRSYYAPLIAKLNEEGLSALRDHFRWLYELEAGEAEITCSEDELVVSVKACPAVSHMREQSYAVSPLFSETTRTVNETLCEGTPFAAELVEYDEETGQSTQRFYRRSA